MYRFLVLQSVCSQQINSSLSQYGTDDGSINGEVRISFLIQQCLSNVPKIKENHQNPL